MSELSKYETMAREDAQEAIAIARESKEPVAWITGNSYMPPLRGFGRAEEVWQAEFDEMHTFAFALYSEAFEYALNEASVALECPDYDNALYVVDIAR